MKELETIKTKLRNRLLFLISMIVRLIAPVKKGRVLMWSYFGKAYSCNPRALTEYLLKNHKGKYDIFWAFQPSRRQKVPLGVKGITFKTFKYIWIVNTAEYLVTNTRNYLSDTLWLKKKKQKYIMTWHSSMGIKCIEGDASVESLSEDYVNAAKFDSKQCDLILSGSRARSEIIKRAFWYSGEVYEHGTPRNDALFDSVYKIEKDRIIREKYNIPDKAIIVLYAPTFRKSQSLKFYTINWAEVIKQFEEKYNKICHVLVKLHPNLIEEGLDTSEIVNYKHVYDATFYPDIQELLVVADVLVTDYSSSMFDFAYMKKTVFLYANDYDTYDRNTYFQLDNLPFLFASSEEQLIGNVKNYSATDYQKNLNVFLEEEIGTFETGKANEMLVKWMDNHSI